MFPLSSQVLLKFAFPSFERRRLLFEVRLVLASKLQISFSQQYSDCDDAGNGDSLQWNDWKIRFEFNTSTKTQDLGGGGMTGPVGKREG